MSKSRIIAITGPENTDQSTLSRNIYNCLTHTYGTTQVSFLSIWDGLQYNNLFEDRETAFRFLKNLRHQTRTLFLFHCFNLALDIAEEIGSQHLIIDGYWHQYAIAEMRHGTSASSLESAVISFPKPDVTLYINSPNDDFENWKYLENRYGPWNHISSHLAANTQLQMALNIISHNTELEGGLPHGGNQHPYQRG